MAHARKYIAIPAVLCLLLVVYLFWSGAGSGPPPKLSVVFLGMTNNPTRQMTPTRVEVCQGATGLCAIFRVVNTASNKFIWFKAASVEQKTETGWQPFVPNSGSWSGVEGSVWQPGYGCLYAVAWPPGLSTNASWRFRVPYGREPSALATIINQKLGREIFKSGRQESTVTSSEVKQ